MSSVWITWETQRRNKELAQSFGCDLYVFDEKTDSKLSRYLKCISKTFQVLTRRPQILFVQCPSIVLCFLSVILKPVFKYKLVIDAHNVAIRYLTAHGFILSLLSSFVFKFSDYIIVSNQGLTENLSVDLTKILVLADRIPKIETNYLRPKIFSEIKPNIVFISSFAKDEPINNFLRAASKLTAKSRFFITGKKSKAKDALKYECEDIVFTDFLSSEDYEALISHSDLNIDLTTEDNLLVCGAYETIAVGVPGMLSDFAVQVETFSKGFVYTPLDHGSIKGAIQYALINKENLKSSIQKFKPEFEQFWNTQFEKCKSTIDG